MTWLSLLVPWHPSPTLVIVMVGTSWLYVRGCRAGAAPTAGRRVAFWGGLVLLYLAWHTQLDYYAERQFFMHRIQQLVLRDVGPFLIAVSAPWPVLIAGWPRRWRWAALQRLAHSRPARIAGRVLTNPLLNGIAYVGLEWFWLIPSVHFMAMLDFKVYRVMNWSMVVEGLSFWSLVLDTRPSPPARVAPGYRLLMAAVVMPFEMAPGILLSFATTNLYPLYELCGRAFAGISTHEDQSVGGLIIWIVGSAVNLVGAMVALYFGFFVGGDEPQGGQEVRKPGTGPV